MCSKEVEKLLRKERIEELYDIGQELGRGKFAIVKRCTEKSTGDQYAAKYLRKRRGGKSCREDILIEIDIMVQARNHHRIVRIHEVFESQREMIIIIELATGGELFRMIAVDPLVEDEARNIVWELLEGVSHLHTLNIVHLDLKPENILLYRKGKKDIKIADFGLALQITPGSQVRTLVGTAEYVAPEILNYEPISIMADMWSIGALTYALLTGYSPFQGETHNDTFYNVSICEYDFDDEVFQNVSQDAKDFIEDLLQKNPNARLTAAQCLQHPWLQPLTTTTQVPEGLNVTTLVPEGLNSSTSSLDSAMCLDSTSSLDPSPISSASSSFAPQPTGKRSEDDHAVKDTCMTQVCSKLCTERQKADESNFSISSNLDGSASSISSNDSCNTLKQEEEDGGVFIPQSTTPPPPHSQRCESSSSSVIGESNSRPGSGLRVTTPLPSNIVSYAPETIEKLKKLEKLKQKKKKDVDSEPEKAATMDRRFSSPVTSVISRMKFSSMKMKSQCEENETESKSPISSVDSSPIEVKKYSISSPVLNRYQTSPSPVPSDTTKQSPVPKHRNTSPSPVPSDITKQSPVPKHRNTSPVPSNIIKQSPVPKHRNTSPSPSPSDNTKQSPVPKHRNETPHETPSSTKPSNSSPIISPITIATRSSSKPDHKQQPSTPLSSTKNCHLTTATKENSPQRGILNSVKGNPPSGSISTVHSVSFNTNTTTYHGKSYSPQTSTKPLENSSNRNIMSSNDNSPVVVYRNKAGKQQVRESWRKTPHIDPDAIEALLNLGDVDPDELINGGGGDAQPFEIGTEKKSNSSAMQNMSPELDYRRKPHDGQSEDVPTSILKKSPGSDSDIVRRNVSRRNVTISSKKSRAAKHQSLYFGSPERSPGLPDKTSPRINKITNLQRSLTMSHSSPDLTAILGGHSKSRKKLKREDTYVTGSCTPKESNRRSFFGGSPLNRSVTMTAGSKGASSKGFLSLKEKYMSKKQ